MSVRTTSAVGLVTAVGGQLPRILTNSVLYTLTLMNVTVYEALISQEQWTAGVAIPGERGRGLRGVSSCLARLLDPTEW